MKNKKCKFCNSDAVNIFLFLLEILPDNPQGYIDYKVHKHDSNIPEVIYTCAKHKILIEGSQIEDLNEDLKKLNSVCKDNISIS